MLVHPPQGTAKYYDFRETAPKAANQDMFNSNPNDSKLGGRAVAVPGEIKGFAAAHRRYGKLPWARLFEPNIALARDGFIVTKKLSMTITKFKDILSRSPGMRKTYFRSDGTPKQPGDTIFRPELAETLEKIANNGEKAFYEGEIAQSLVQTVREAGGIMTLEDLAGYEAREADALRSTYQGYQVFTSGAPSAGPVLIEALNILSNFDLRSKSETDRNQILVEALKFAYGSRMRLGDPEFESEMAHELQRLQDPESARKISAKISLEHTHNPEYYTETLDKVHDGGTTHVSVLDAEGMGVSATCTINLEFGSKLMDPRTGIILNNEMDDFSIPNHQNQFSLPPSPSNYIKPGKRPMSSSTPVILTHNGQIQMIAGGTGGSRIISSTLLALIQMIDLGRSADEAVDSPRFHHQLLPNYLVAENEVSETVIEWLRARGHLVHVLEPRLYFSSVQAIKRDPVKGTLIAAADGRKGGGTDGY